MPRTMWISAFCRGFLLPAASPIRAGIVAPPAHAPATVGPPLEHTVTAPRLPAGHVAATAMQRRGHGPATPLDGARRPCYDVGVRPRRGGATVRRCPHGDHPLCS